MGATRADLKRWIRGFEAARTASDQAGSPLTREQAVDLSLSMIEAGRQHARTEDPERDREVAEVRRVWARLRALLS